MQPSDGAIYLNGRLLKQHDLTREAAFMPSDRHTEGLATGLTVRENAALAALDKFVSGGLGILSRRKELNSVGGAFRSLAVKAPSIEAPVLSLSGGNQQKVVMARALLSEPRLIVADGPTQGVDVGARAEIYRILREVSNSGTPVVVNSSDAAELEGLCDQVIVMSRGRVVETLSGDDVVEARIVAAAVGAVAHLDAGESAAGDGGRRERRGFRHFVQTDNAPAIPLALVTVLLGLFVFSQNSNYLSAFNVSNILLLATALGFIALGQTVAILSSGIDLSVGPLAGFLVVIASFFVNDGQAATTIAAGFALMFIAALVVGSINGLLMRFANFTPIAATLAMYIGLQGCSFLLRDGPDGYINSDVVAAITWLLGPIPVAFLVMVAFAIAAEYTLRRLRPGWQLRAIGSDEESARRIGVRIDRTFVAAYIVTLAVYRAWRGDADGADRRRRSAAGRELHALEHHGGGSRRHQPARRARHVHRHGARRCPAHGSAQRHFVPGAIADLSIRFPGRAHPARRSRLLDGARAGSLKRVLPADSDERLICT